ncbi:MAG: hypothetical protein H6582_12460 [Crocinitomicaceae bacterium]|nr:hypothetical protein [Crocinitomicaceae bacterium]
MNIGYLSLFLLWLFPPQDTTVAKDYFADGKIYTVTTIKNGVKWGPYKMYHRNGQVQVEGEYQEGMMVGKWTYRYDTGIKSSEGSYNIFAKNGVSESKKHGEWTKWHRNGLLESKGNYYMGVAVGVWKYYDDTGELTESKNFGEYEEFEIPLKKY